MQTATSSYLLDEKLQKNARILSLDPVSITWDENYNNKLGCNAFIHIDQAPKNPPIRSTAEQLKITISTADGSHPPVVVKMIDILLIQLKNIPAAFTLASHGLDCFEFAQYFIDKSLGKLNLYSEVAVYYYRKI